MTRSTLRTLRSFSVRNVSAMTPALQGVPALRTMATGDTSAAGLAQCAHLVVLSTRCADLSFFVTLEDVLPVKVRLLCS